MPPTPESLEVPILEGGYIRSPLPDGGGSLRHWVATLLPRRTTKSDVNRSFWDREFRPDGRVYVVPPYLADGVPVEFGADRIEEGTRLRNRLHFVVAGFAPPPTLAIVLRRFDPYGRGADPILLAGARISGVTSDPSPRDVRIPAAELARDLTYYEPNPVMAFVREVWTRCLGGTPDPALAKAASRLADDRDTALDVEYIRSVVRAGAVSTDDAIEMLRRMAGATPGPVIEPPPTAAPEAPRVRRIIRPGDEP